MNFVFSILRRLSLDSLYKIGRFFGRISFYLMRGRRRIAEKNCEIIGVNKSAVKPAFENIFCSFLELAYLHRIDSEFILNNVIIENEERIRKFVDKNNSAFIVSAHIGSWEFITLVFKEVFKVNAAIVGRKIKNPKINEFVVNQRSQCKVKYFTHRNVVGTISKLINEGYYIGSLLDHSALDKDSIYVDFFGYKTSFIAGIPLLALRKKIPILPVFLIRKNGYYHLIDYPPIYPEKKGDLKENMVKIARKINESYEDIITKYPEQWYLIHKRFKRVKDGEKTCSLY